MSDLVKMTKLTKLSDEQIARFPEFVDRWTKIGLCTDPANRQDAESAIAMMYRAANLEPPKKIIWCGSPLSQGLVRSIILNKKFLDSVGASVWDSVGDSVMDSVRDSVMDSVRDSVRASVRDSVGASVRASVRDSVRASVWDSVRDSVWDSVRASVGASVWASVGASVYGSHEAGWLSFYRYFYDACALVEQTKKLDGLCLLAKSAGWALPHKNICWVSERHCVLERDERGRLHSLTGPAVAYPDGWAIYAFHGVRVPSHWIERANTLTASDVFKEQNAEVRRAGCEIIGWDRVIAGIDAKLIDADGDEFIGTLYRGTIPGAKECGFLKVRCGTGRVFVIPVAASCQSAIEAQAWIANVKPEVWNKPEVRG
jgi:hypothetical protein